MTKVILTADSGIDPIDESHMIPCQINCDGKGYRDNHIEINNDKILNDAKKGIYYKTSAPLLGDYEGMFKKILENGYDIVHIAMSNKVSSSCVSYSNAVANEFNDQYGKHISVVDSLTGATGGTLLYEYASTLLDQGLTRDELKQELDNIKTSIKTNFFVPNPVGFIRSGRNSHALNLAEKAIAALKLKFRVDFYEDGSLGKNDILRGTNEASFYKMLKNIINELGNNIDGSKVIIGTVKEMDINMDNLKKYLTDNKMNVIRKNINGCVAAYGSPDLVGFSYILKK